MLKLFLLIILASPAQANTELHDCNRWRLSSRNGSIACWARFPIHDGTDLCIPRELWLRWLARAQKTDSRCRDWPGRWKEVSAPRNLPPSWGDSEEKKRLTRFVVTGLPALSGEKAGLLDPIQWRIEDIREKISGWIEDGDALGICRHLLIHQNLPENKAGVLRKLGFVHVFTATGIHLYALSLWLHAIARALTRRCRFSPRGGLWLARAFSVLGSLAAWILNGAPAGMLRPWIILGARALARTLGFRWRTGSPLFLALCLHTIASGFQIDSGGLVYALAVGGSLTAAERSDPWHARLALGSWLFAAIWESWRGGLVAIFTPALSLITLPLFCLILYPALFLSVGLHVIALDGASAMVIRAVVRVTSRILAPLLSMTMALPTLWIVSRWAVLMGAALSCLVLLFRTTHFAKRARVSVGLGTLLALLVVGIRNLPVPARSVALYIDQLDVGQGDAALVVSENGAGLVDAGKENALSDESWLELLARRGITRIDWIALTHLDEDHSGGVKRLAALIPIRCVVTSAAEIRATRGERFRAELAHQEVALGDWSQPCVPFPTLAPIPERQSGYRRNENMGAIWIPLEDGNSYLSAGDADAHDELRIGRWAAEQKQGSPGAFFLKLSHHGSHTSSGEEFLRELRPTEAWISVGTGNRYGHPSLQVLERLDRLGIPIRRTDRDGFLTTKGGGDRRPR